MKSYVIITAVLLVLATATGGTQVIDFEEFYTGIETSYGLLDGYAGFTWSSSAKWITSQNSPNTGYERGTIGHVSLYTSGYKDISMSSAIPFDFTGAYITSAHKMDQDVTVEGWRAGNMLFSETIVTSKDRAYWFDFDFADIDALWFRPGTVEGETNWHIAIDNITVPEPCSLILLGIGGLALGRKPRPHG